MIDIQLKGGIDGELFRRLDAIERADPIVLAQRIRTVIIDENERGLRDGTDADGSETAPLTEATIKRGRGGFGPPRVPRFASSRLISGFEVAVARVGDRQYVLRGGWPGLDFVRHLNDGTRHMVARPVSGLRPTTRAQVEEQAHNYAVEVAEGRS